MVTGAAGQLGTEICLLLLESGIPFVAVDKNPGSRNEYPVKTLDLLSMENLAELFDGISVLIHTANHTNWFCGTPETVYCENVSMNMKLFQAAADAGCDRIVFSSSIQVLNGQLPSYDRSAQEILLPYIPMDSEMPAIPRNSYALSKQASESMLKYYSETKKVTCISLRFPWLLNADLLKKALEEGGIKRENAFDGFVYLPLYSAAEVTLRAAASEHNGYHEYFVASKDNLEQSPASEIIRRELSHVPLKKPIQEIDNLVDCSKVEAELGWIQPQSLRESYLRCMEIEKSRK